MSIAESVMLPIAGVIFTYVVVTDLIQMQMAQNNMHEHTTWDIYKWIFKTAIGALFISNSFTISAALIEVGAEIVTKVIPIANAAAANGPTITTGSSLMDLNVWDLLSLNFTLMLTSVIYWGGKIIIQLFLVARFFEIYLYLMVAPIPFSTLTNQQLSQTGLNYIKNVIALALQAVIILISFAIYTALSTSYTLNVVIDPAKKSWASILEGITLILVLVVMVWRSRSVAQSIVGSH